MERYDKEFTGQTKNKTWEHDKSNRSHQDNRERPIRKEMIVEEIITRRVTNICRGNIRAVIDLRVTTDNIAMRGTEIDLCLSHPPAP
ncbi:hypothetical protein AQUCO_06200011v1 [Aquilegia coerulea]|uniref:Uncharacterized protein n=1 Tax=Aquilegia coerulea TaxID=218851 RepID=A0A2G5CE48_AQUCA|nr:hypothetical protein AQUCO_06200011v1 [Aquilegia coerulea]